MTECGHFAKSGILGERSSFGLIRPTLLRTVTTVFQLLNMSTNEARDRLTAISTAIAALVADEKRLKNGEDAQIVEEINALIVSI